VAYTTDASTVLCKHTLIQQIQSGSVTAGSHSLTRTIPATTVDVAAAAHVVETENMRLADFILRDMEPILAEWETFAASHLPAAATMDSLALRDHAPEILRAIVLDLNSSQSSYEQDQKAKGRAQVLRDSSHTAAQTHALASGHKWASVSSSWRRNTARCAPVS
jgi:hypothetical protein